MARSAPGPDALDLRLQRANLERFMADAFPAA